MISAIEITSRAPFVGGASFGAAGSYERLDGVAIGELDPALPANRGIVNLDKAPRNARGNVEYRSDICILRPADPDRGNGRILYEVNNRGRIMLFASLCAGKPGNQPTDPGGISAMRCRCGWASRWSGRAGTRARRGRMAGSAWMHPWRPMTASRSCGVSARSSSRLNARAGDLAAVPPVLRSGSARPRRPDRAPDPAGGAPARRMGIRRCTHAPAGPARIAGARLDL